MTNRYAFPALTNIASTPSGRHAGLQGLACITLLMLSRTQLLAGAPDILGAVAHSFTHQLTIMGTNFGPATGSPVVRLAGRQLTLATWSAVKIVANLPAALAPGRYQLTVTVDTLTGGFDVTIGAAGPQQPAGPAAAACTQAASGSQDPQGPPRPTTFPYAITGSIPDFDIPVFQICG